MRIVIVYKEESDHAREVFDFLRDFETRTGRSIEEIDPDSVRNEFFVQAYDVVEYPTILAITDEGKVLNQWKGRPLPLIDEVSYYLR